MRCPICNSENSIPYELIDGYEYFQCGKCKSLHISDDVIRNIDRGESPRIYNQSYWNQELKDALERARGPSLVRAGEAILYCRRPVTRFLDVGTGPGYFLDEISRLYPNDKELFHGVELFPPDEHSKNDNYHIGDVSSLKDGKYDAGICIEVVEHLTPSMLSDVVISLAKLSHERSIWLFNTGLPEYVMKEDKGYLDPINRGHIISYSIDGLKKIFEPHGFNIFKLPGKSFAFIAEYNPGQEESASFEQRIFSPIKENEDLLIKNPLLYQAVSESARGYFYYEGYVDRTQWALNLDQELKKIKSKNNSNV